jgi:hypothetical protein
VAGSCSPQDSLCFCLNAQEALDFNCLYANSPSDFKTQLVDRNRICHSEEGKMRSRIITLLAACLLATGFGSFLTANSASAATRYQICFGGSCLNAWNGGPLVKVYSSGAANNFFETYHNPNNGYYEILFLNMTPYGHDCVGDYNNNPNDAKAGLYSDCTAGSIAWGANFTEDTSHCGAGEIAFRNVHWGGWLAPAGLSNGSQFYLNNSSAHCFSVSTFLG